MAELTLLSSKNVLLPDGMAAATLTLEQGRIVSIVKERITSTKAQPVTDYGDSVIMPGLIDSHVRANEPGREDWEGFESITAAAAAGGITTLIDMPLDCDPVTTNLEALRKKIRAADNKLAVNCGFWAGLISSNIAQIEPLAKAGVFGFCAYLSESGNDDFPSTSIKELELLAPKIALTGLPLAVHALSPKSKNGKLPKPKDQYSYKAFLETIPSAFEADAVRELVRISSQSGVDMHILHLSSAEVLPIIQEARKKGIRITVETCPHYLHFSSEKIPDHDTRFKCDPPIREESNRKSLWKGLSEGIIGTIVSDHRPAPAEIRELDTGHFANAYSGIASLQFSLPVSWTAAQAFKIPLESIATWMSSNVAERFGLTGKGSLKEGYDADLVVWNPAKKMKVSKHIIRSRHVTTPYEGEMLTGMVEETWVGGVKVYSKGDFPESRSGKVLLKNLV